MLAFRRLAGRALACLALAGLAVAGCSGGESQPEEPEVPVAPVPNSPANALRLLEWCWDNLDEDSYRELFTGDYTYVFAPADSQPPGERLTREEELGFAGNLFDTGAPSRPAATRIVFELNSALVAQPDSRPGKHPTWHKEIRSNGVRVIAITPARTYSVLGPMTFFLTRGDSAVIPQELIDRGFGPDPNRWYVDGWYDETVCENEDKPCEPLGRLKLDYLPSPAPARPLTSR